MILCFYDFMFQILSFTILSRDLGFDLKYTIKTAFMLSLGGAHRRFFSFFIKKIKAQQGFAVLRGSRTEVGCPRPWAPFAFSTS